MGVVEGRGLERDLVVARAQRPAVRLQHDAQEVRGTRRDAILELDGIGLLGGLIGLAPDAYRVLASALARCRVAMLGIERQDPLVAPVTRLVKAAVERREGSILGLVDVATPL